MDTSVWMGSKRNMYRLHNEIFKNLFKYRMFAVLGNLWILKNDERIHKVKNCFKTVEACWLAWSREESDFLED